MELEGIRYRKANRVCVQVVLSGCVETSQSIDHSNDHIGLNAYKIVRVQVVFMHIWRCSEY